MALASSSIFLAELVSISFLLSMLYAFYLHPNISLVIKGYRLDGHTIHTSPAPFGQLPGHKTVNLIGLLPFLVYPPNITQTQWRAVDASRMLCVWDYVGRISSDLARHPGDLYKAFLKAASATTSRAPLRLLQRQLAAIRDLTYIAFIGVLAYNVCSTSLLGNLNLGPTSLANCNSHSFHSDFFKYESAITAVSKVFSFQRSFTHFVTLEEDAAITAAEVMYLAISLCVLSLLCEDIAVQTAETLYLVWFAAFLDFVRFEEEAATTAALMYLVCFAAFPVFVRFEEVAATTAALKFRKSVFIGKYGQEIMKRWRTVVCLSGQCAIDGAFGIWPLQRNAVGHKGHPGFYPNQAQRTPLRQAPPPPYPTQPPPWRPSQPVPGPIRQTVKEAFGFQSLQRNAAGDKGHHAFCPSPTPLPPNPTQPPPWRPSQPVPGPIRQTVKGAFGYQSLQRNVAGDKGHDAFCPSQTPPYPTQPPPWRPSQPVPGPIHRALELGLSNDPLPSQPTGPPGPRPSQPIAGPIRRTLELGLGNDSPPPQPTGPPGPRPSQPIWGPVRRKRHLSSCPDPAPASRDRPFRANSASFPKPDDVHFRTAYPSCSDPAQPHPIPATKFTEVDISANLITRQSASMLGLGHSNLAPAQKVYTYTNATSVSASASSKRPCLSLGPSRQGNSNSSLSPDVKVILNQSLNYVSCKSCMPLV
jgi:hypothetical protein